MYTSTRLYGRPDRHTLATGEWHADFYPRVARSEHRRIEALCLTGLELSARYAIVFIEVVSYRPARLCREVKDDDRRAEMPCDERWRADDPPPLQPFLNDHLALK